MIKALLIFIVVLLVATFPATWLLMLFFGNLGMGLSYWASLPARHPRVGAARWRVLVQLRPSLRLTVRRRAASRCRRFWP